jgi:hypothetical protein
MAQRPGRPRREPATTRALDTRLTASVKLAGQRARTVLAKFSDVDVPELQAAIEAVFESWKQEYGAGNPTPVSKARGKLAIDRNPIAFADAKPYQCAGPTVANNIDLALRLFAEDYLPFWRLPGFPNVMLLILADEIDAHPDVDPSSVIRALSLSVRLIAGWHENEEDWLTSQLHASARFRLGLSKGAAQGGAAVKKAAQLKRSQCIALDNDLLRNPATRDWSLKARTNSVHKKMVQQTPPGKKTPAWSTVRDYLKNNKRKFFKSMKV